RGRLRKISDEDIKVIESFLENEGWDARTLAWDQLLLAARVYIDCNTRTIQRTLQQRGWHKYTACRKNWLSDTDRKRRVEAARKALEERPNLEDWRDIRFSDEWHSTCRQSRQIQIIRREGERYL